MEDTSEIKNFNNAFDFFKKNDNQIEYFGKTLGKGAYGEVREVKLKNSLKMMAAKLVKKDNDNTMYELEVAQDLRGNNIIKINKAISREYNGEDYDLIIMEKAILRDLGKLTEFYYKHNLLKLIIEDPFVQKIGDNFLRFYAKQIIDGLETLDRNYFVHFDIKPENLLITINLNIKLSDFGLITKVRDDDKIKIPGGTQGYLTEEYFNKEKVSVDVARKQDYFALGSTLYYLKFGEHLLKYQKFDEQMLNAEKIIKLLNVKIAYIRSRQESEQEFIDFLTSLIHYNPDERPSFEQIYRNKWLNSNRDELELITASNESDEEKIIMELQKSDFLINEKKEIMPKKKENFRFKKKK